MKSVQIFAPATVANVGPGYDTFGFALEQLGDILTVTLRDDDQLVNLPADGADLPLEEDQNVASVAIRAMLDDLGENTGMSIHVRKSFNPGSGLGSSASSAAGAVFAANELLGNPYTSHQLLPFALLGEAVASKSIHADNVAPALLGGFQMARSYEPLDVFEIPVPETLRVLIIKPEVEVKTSEAKSMLPKQVDIPVARNQWANTAALVHALHTADFKLLKRAISDEIAEPVRHKLIPFYTKARQAANECGAVGFNISGSGPSMFALFTNAEMAKVAMDSIENIYQKEGISVMLHLSKINPKGCQVL